MAGANLTLNYLKILDVYINQIQLDGNESNFDELTIKHNLLAFVENSYYFHSLAVTDN